ncbi:unnamed protein product [Adineta steineri]|uniref:Transmembrane protein n=1 Tax=Adineta steineri TaxID=433720 RepID=A0A814DDV8_9BILA|nr:unnamed protein product [Adineta steineri]CAF1253815.1 unnamed protein product [Adineta steineri]
MKLYCSSILCSWIYCLISFIDTLMFALTGYMDVFTFRLLIFLAHFVVLIAEILFLFILILCSKGYLIVKIQLRNRVITEIILIILLYLSVQISILIMMIIFVDQIFINEKIFPICDYIQIILYLLVYIWFLINAITILLNILNILPNPQVTISKAIQISNQCLAYCIFLFILRKKHFFLQTKLNQINITYVHSITSKSHSNQISTREIVSDINSYEFTDLCYDEVNTWVSRFRIPFKSSESLPRLEPRRDVKLKSLAKSSQSSMCIVPRRLATLNSNDQF